jgi:hypothetical protein
VKVELYVRHSVMTLAAWGVAEQACEPVGRGLEVAVLHSAVWQRQVR